MQTYRVQEIFYSLQGEGQWTGRPMAFIRLSGCNLNCSFCDTVHDQPKDMTTEEILKQVVEYPTNKVVLTGGEPLIQSVLELLTKLREYGFAVHLETNGTQPIRELESYFNWIAISPKSPIDTLSEDIFLADEMKFLCGLPGWENYIKDVLERFGHQLSRTKLYLMPIAKSKHFYRGLDRSREELIDVNVEAAKSYCLQHSEFSFCIQMHKVLGIR